MKFSVLVAILAEDLEEKAIKSAKAAGAGGITILNGRGLGAEEKNHEESGPRPGPEQRQPWCSVYLAVGSYSRHRSPSDRAV